MTYRGCLAQLAPVALELAGVDAGTIPYLGLFAERVALEDGARDVRATHLAACVVVPLTCVCSRLAARAPTHLAPGGGEW